MQTLTVGQIALSAGGRILRGNAETKIKGITTDSRMVEEGMLFVPIAGARMDGHDFIEKAYAAGAVAVIAHKPVDCDSNGGALIAVEDTYRAIGDIAAYYKEKYNIPTVGVTGSVGKTTTKDMVAGALSAGFNTLKTEGNFNNELGVPLTVFRIEREHEAAVIELGMSHFGEIRRLAEIAKPDIAVITNIGMSHIENLGSQEGIFKAKMEIAERFSSKYTLIVNGDGKFLSGVRGMGDYRTVYYGVTNPNNDVRAENITDNGLSGVEFDAVFYGERRHVRLQAAGIHNVYNALAAICAGKELSEDTDAVISGIESFQLTRMRMETETADGITTINDCYNASPDSIRAALAVLKSAGGRKIAVLGDILEMGGYAEDAHYALGKDAAQADILVTAGKNAKHLARGAKDAGADRVYSFDTTKEAAAFVPTILEQGDTVLIKASRGMKFEDIYNAVRNKG